MEINTEIMEVKEELMRKVLKVLQENSMDEELCVEFKELVNYLYGIPKEEIHITEADLEGQEFVVWDSEQKKVRGIVENGLFRLEGEEYGDKYCDSDNYEYAIEFDKLSTEQLFLELRRDFGQETALKNIFKENVCLEGSYYGLLRYCERKNIAFNMTTF